MRELTFLGFLTRYVRSLSLCGSNSLYKLAEEAGNRNPRLREPLGLYALWSGKKELLFRAAKDTELNRHYMDLFSSYPKSKMEAALKEQDHSLPEEYRKVWRSYLSERNRAEAADHTKELMRGKLKRLQDQKGISNYRIYTALDMNPGNLNAWLKHGDGGKVSLETARRALRYVESAQR